ncbi:AAA family ATPase [Psychromarinibacter sp. S121]|uniref:bifunctional aminoglycoside phosphotransferase/ATP-binding protein n=1 Tax=Psychromarinibacter sp. S121 TaxID=3415127 RepID=UPI003C7A1C55
MSDQSDVIAFLSSSDAFGGDAGPVQRIDTHGALVFLCGGTALKLKRAVHYDYMDLSTVDLRHKMLDRELSLNAPHAPTIYRDVVPVTRGADGLGLGGEGAVVDWVLRMNRFPSENELEAIDARGAFDNRLAAAVGQMIQRYHHSAPVRRGRGRVLIAEILDELGRVFAEFPGAVGTDRVDDYLAAARVALDGCGDLLDRRAEAGHVRRGHGDLHLRNLVVVEGKPVPFDALEFSEELGTCDVLYDLAFLIMDLDQRRLEQASTRVLSTYLACAQGTEDEGLAALPLFISVRAAIRAMVLLQTDKATDRPGASGAGIGSHIDAALAALDPQPPRLVAVGGFSGSGKSVLAGALAPGLGAAPGAVLLSTDEARKIASGVAQGAHLPEAGYSQGARGAVYDGLFARAEAILKAGHSVILDGTFLDPAQRAAAMDLAAGLGVPGHGLWLDAPVAELEARIAQRTGDWSDADVSVLARQMERGTGPLDWTRIDAATTLEQTLAAARLAVGV